VVDPAAVVEEASPFVPAGDAACDDDRDAISTDVPGTDEGNSADGNVVEGRMVSLECQTTARDICTCLRHLSFTSSILLFGSSSRPI
jgi:hypothetical protein